MNKINRDEKKAEALQRMEMLGIAANAINVYEEHDIVPFFITGTEETMLGVPNYEHELIATFEEDCNALVYCVIYCKTTFGDLESLLFVSDEKDEWEMDREDIKDGYAMTWTENLTYPECSEYGSIAISVTKEGSLNREG